MSKMHIIKNIIVGVDQEGKPLHYIEAAGDSTDDKPTETDVGGPIVDSSTAIESNTANVFFYNGKTSTWIEA